MQGIFTGRTQLRYPYGRYGYTRGGGKIWHGGMDLVGLDSTDIRMPYYKNKRITGKVVRARRVTDHSNKTWEWGWYVCVQLDPGQTPDDVNYLYFCHCRELKVTAGQAVASGDLLAVMGQSGNAAGGYKHVHLEARNTVTGRGVDPTRYSGTLNAVGVYGAANNGSTEQISAQPTGKTMQCIMVGPLDAAAAAKCDALATQLELVGAGRYYSMPAAGGEVVKAIGAVSNGDAVKFYALAEAEGWKKDNKYVARYVG